MKTLFDAASRQQAIDRLASLSDANQRQWGKMTLPQALSHMGDQLALALGEIEVKPIRGPLAWPPFKQIVLFVLPWPKNVKTAPELLKTRIEDVDAARQRVLELIDRFVAVGEQGSYSRHPLFGQLDARTWAYLALRHLDHHLRQFSA